MILKSLAALAMSSSVLLAAVPAVAASKGVLNISVYNPGAKGVFAVSSEIIAGQSEVLLVDAQFAKADAEEVVRRVKATGKTLKTVYVSHSDPDFYFGLATIHAAFPDARIVATPQTVAAIKASKDGKLAFWGPVLKNNAPDAIVVPEPLDGDTLTVDGTPLKIVGLDGPTPDRTFLWVPSSKAVIGGVLVFANEHIWIADTQTLASRENWKRSLDAMLALKPDMVVPAHFLPDPDGHDPLTAASVRWTRAYLEAFEAEAAKAHDSAELIAAMKQRYPGLAGDGSLETSAKVIKGEMQWPAPDPASTYPAAGKKVQIDFEGTIFQLDFADASHMAFVGTAGAFKGVSDSVTYVAKPIHPGIFMVYWHEPKTGSNVVHVQDFEKGMVFTNIAKANGEFQHLSGTIRILGDH